MKIICTCKLLLFFFLSEGFYEANIPLIDHIVCATSTNIWYRNQGSSSCKHSSTCSWQDHLLLGLKRWNVFLVMMSLLMNSCAHFYTNPLCKRIVVGMESMNVRVNTFESQPTFVRVQCFELNISHQLMVSSLY
jgi:hypothetical protein